MGIRYGGRRKGSRNKRTIEAQFRAEADAMKIKIRPKQAMLTIMEMYLGLVAKYQPGTKDEPNANFSEDKFEKYTQLALDAANKAAPYYDARLAHTTLQTSGDKPLMSLLKVVFVDPPKDAYVPQLTNGNGHDGSAYPEGV